MREADERRRAVVLSRAVTGLVVMAGGVAWFTAAVVLTDQFQVLAVLVFTSGFVTLTDGLAATPA